MGVLGDRSRSAAARKKAIVAVARQLAVDLWRLFTGQTTAENLGLIYLPEAARCPEDEAELKPPDQLAIEELNFTISNPSRMSRVWGFLWAFTTTSVC